MDSILHFSLGWLIFSLCFNPAASGALLYLVTQHGPLAAPLQGFKGVVARFFASVGIIFAVFSAFLGADIWERVQHSNHSLESEAAGVQSIVQIAKSLGKDGIPVVRNIDRYVNATLELELAGGSRDRSRVADAALEGIVQAILALPQGNGASSAAQGAMLAAYDRIREARTTRRHIANTHSDPYKWMAVLILGCLTQASLALCHIDKRKPLAATLFVFTLAFAVTMVALAIHERPLSDPKLVSMGQLKYIVGKTLDF